MAILCKVGISFRMLDANCFLAVLSHESYEPFFRCHIAKSLCSQQSLIV